MADEHGVVSPAGNDGQPVVQPAGTPDDDRRRWDEVNGRFGKLQQQLTQLTEVLTPVAQHYAAQIAPQPTQQQQDDGWEPGIYPTAEQVDARLQRRIAESERRIADHYNPVAATVVQREQETVREKAWRDFSTAYPQLKERRYLVQAVVGEESAKAEFQQLPWERQMQRIAQVALAQLAPLPPDPNPLATSSPNIRNGAVPEVTPNRADPNRDTSNDWSDEEAVDQMFANHPSKVRDAVRAGAAL